MIYIFLVKVLVVFIILKIAFTYSSRFVLQKIGFKFPFSENIRRQILFRLAASDLLTVPLGLFLFGVMYGLTWAGFFVLPGLNEINQGQGPSFLMWLMSTDALSLLYCFVFGVVSGFLLRGYGLSVVLVTVFLFPFLISTPGAALMIFGDVTAYWLLTYRKHDVFGVSLRFLSTFIAVILFWVFGGYLRELLNGFELNSFNPFDRSLQVLLLVAVLVAVDTVMSHFTLHFYFHHVIRKASS